MYRALIQPGFNPYNITIPSLLVEIVAYGHCSMHNQAECFNGILKHVRKTNIPSDDEILQALDLMPLTHNQTTKID